MTLRVPSPRTAFDTLRASWREACVALYAFDATREIGQGFSVARAVFLADDRTFGWAAFLCLCGLVTAVPSAVAVGRWLGDARGRPMEPFVLRLVAAMVATMLYVGLFVAVYARATGYDGPLS